MSSNQAVKVIQSIISNIGSSSKPNTDELTSLLQLLPITALTSDRSDTLIGLFLNECFKYKNEDAALIIVNFFDEMRVRVDPLPAIIQIFLNNNIDRSVQLFMVDCYKDKAPIDYYIDLINITCPGGDIIAVKIAAILSTIFNNLSSADWNFLLKLTDSDPNVENEEDLYPNQGLRLFLQTKAAETNNIFNKPSWIKDYPANSVSHIPKTIPSVKEALNLLLNSIRNQLLFDDKGKVINVEQNTKVINTLISQYAISTIPEKISMLSSVLDIAPFDDSDIFREFGPVNCIYSDVPSMDDENYECTKYGGCRMFTCSEFENMYSNGDQIDIFTIEEHTSNIDWFRKSCDKCMTKIPKRHYAIRRPLINGGWLGCFCSIDCMKHDVNDPHISLMIGRIQEQLNRIGIRDR